MAYDVLNYQAKIVPKTRIYKTNSQLINSENNKDKVQWLQHLKTTHNTNIYMNLWLTFLNIHCRFVA